MVQLSVTRTTTTTAVILHLRGEIDLATADETCLALFCATEGVPPQSLMVLDLRSVTFVAVAGARALQQFASVAELLEIDCRLVVSPDSVIHRIFDILGMSDDLIIYPTIDEAIAVGR